MKIYINNQAITLQDQQVIGKGGEADIYQIDSQTVVKIFKSPQHPDYANQSSAQKGAKERLEIHQKKLRVYPKSLPSGVIAPVNLASSDKACQSIIGYTMPYLKDMLVLMQYTIPQIRQNGIDGNMIKEIFLKLHQIVQKVHQQQVIIGDFNDLNVMIKETDPYLIDADSFQFGNFLCNVFTRRFVDPLLCEEINQQMILTKPHNHLSDWYAFTVMLMSCLLFVDPYGGIYRPKSNGKKIAQELRPLHRITIFDPDVRYPKPAIPYGVLPDEVLQFFHQTFQNDKRDIFPYHLIHSLEWKTCPQCKCEHARATCPNCWQKPPSIVITKMTIKGKVKVNYLFETKGFIISASLAHSQLKWIYHERNQFYRENHNVIHTGKYSPFYRFGIYGEQSIIGAKGSALIINQQTIQQRIMLDQFQNMPVIVANDRHYYWIENGQLQRNGDFGAFQIGQVLQNQTQIWVGQNFGFGYYRAGQMCVGFVFDAVSRGINDQIKLNLLNGQLIDNQCYFSSNLAWVFFTIQHNGQIYHQIFIVRPDGHIVTEQQILHGKENWLYNIKGKFAIGSYLFCPTDDGLVRVELINDQIEVTRTYPDTESFVQANDHLFAGNNGMYVVSNQRIIHLTLTA